jgi:hypothetical protein
MILMVHNFEEGIVWYNRWAYIAQFICRYWGKQVETIIFVSYTSPYGRKSHTNFWFNRYSCLFIPCIACSHSSGNLPSTSCLNRLLHQSLWALNSRKLCKSNIIPYVHMHLSNNVVTIYEDWLEVSWCFPSNFVDMSATVPYTNNPYLIWSSNRTSSNFLKEVVHR